MQHLVLLLFFLLLFYRVPLGSPTHPALHGTRQVFQKNVQLSENLSVQKSAVFNLSVLLQAQRRLMLSSPPRDSSATGGTSAGTNNTLTSGTGTSFSTTQEISREWVSLLRVKMRDKTNMFLMLLHTSFEGSSTQFSVEPYNRGFSCKRVLVCNQPYWPLKEPKVWLKVTMESDLIWWSIICSLLGSL